ncbi:Fic family protein [Microbacterium sp. ZW T5_56]|uniref:Fic family protein n=1 Tax=Microbacterium sp. ZW T5_56 TaxID=3378081 RepID=UPI0038534BDA
MSSLYRLPALEFGSDLMATLFEIERLRADIGTGNTPSQIKEELHFLFDVVMSVVSARIEGNHTTVYQALDGAIPEESPSQAEQLHEIANIAEATRFLDSRDPREPLTHALLRDLHAQVVDGLSREGDPTPGAYREVDVAIAGSAHQPPTWVTLHAEMAELLRFANLERPPHEQMMQIALAHHRFVWVHPFRNGNGRVSRLFTYAMLRRTIFATRGFSALNPAAVFGNDRSAYISALEAADSLSDDGTKVWLSFFATGIRDDLARLVLLQDHAYVADKLVLPALDSLLRDGLISLAMREVLAVVLQRGTVKAGDLAGVLPGDASQRSRAIRELIDRRLLRRTQEGTRFYQLLLSRGPLAPRLIRRLDELGHLPRMLADD